ncbi:MAG: SH3 domain-containing protein [Cyanobacteria bacterium J06626_4]
MTILKIDRSLLLLSLGFIIAGLTGQAAATTPDAIRLTASPALGAVLLPAVETQVTFLANLPPSVEAQAAGGELTNDAEKCFVMLAYDPEDTSVNLRDRPDGNIVTSLPNFTPLGVHTGPAFVEPGWNFIHVLAPDRSAYQQSGYVWHELIRRTHYQVEDPQDSAANFRQSPDGPVIDTLANGTEVQFMGEAGTWTQVKLADNRIGYVATALLTDPSCF